MSYIALSDITFGYSDDEPPVFSHFHLSVERGTCLAVVGENGSGKTTLFRILNGLSFPTEGQYLFDGQQITRKYLRDNRKAKYFHKQVGYLFQNPDVMLFNATVYDEIAFGPRQMGLSDGEVRTRTGDCLKMFELEQLAGKAPYHLSEGQKKRVALAAVLSLNPEVVILDEPFAGLDQTGQDKLMQLLTDLKAAGRTILIATHNPLVRESLADTVLTL